MIYKAYRYLFYCNYLWQEKWGWGLWDKKETTIAQWAMAGVVFPFILNFFTLLVIIQFFTGFNLLNKILVLPDWLAIVTGSPILIFHYFLFLYRDQYKEIIKEFNYKFIDKQNKKYLMSITWVYFLVGIFMLFLSKQIFLFGVTSIHF